MPTASDTRARIGRSRQPWFTDRTPIPVDSSTRPGTTTPHRTTRTSAVDAKIVAQRVVDGDPVAVAVWERAVWALARAILATITLTGIDLVVVGGGLAQSGETLLAPLRAEIEALRTFQRPPRIVTPRLADWAGCLGAACLAWDAS